MTIKSDRSVTQAAISSKSTFASYETLLTGSDISFEKRHPWLVVGKPDFNDKLVICLSISIKHAEQILSAVLPILKQQRVSFILVADQLQHNRINNHAFPLELFGKPLIIFPKNLDVTKKMLEDLVKVTNEFNALALPNCLQVGNLCYVAFSTRISHDVEHPFPYKFKITQEHIEFLSRTILLNKPRISRLIAGRYLPFKLILSSHKGNIIKGIDMLTLRWCFIKQAREWAGEDIYGRQMKDRLHWQMCIAKLLQNSINIPKVVKLIHCSDYTYLVSEYIHGQSLDALIKAGKSDLSNLLSIIQKAAVEIQKMHAIGYLHRDITAKNIVLSSKGQVFVTDLELAYPISGATFLPFESGTIGYMSQQQSLGLDPQPEDDFFAFGALLYYTYSGQHPRSLCHISEDEREKKIQSCAAPEKVKSYLKAALSHIALQRPNVAELYSMIDQQLNETYDAGVNPSLVRPFKKQTVLSISTILLAFITVYILWQTSADSNIPDNGFDRRYISEAISPFKDIVLPSEVAYIAGLSTDSLYLTSIQERELYSISKGGSQYSKLVPFPNYYTSSDKGAKPSISVTPYGTLLLDGIGKTLLIKNERGSGIKKLTTSEPFSRAVPINDSLIIIRKFKPGVRDQVLFLINNNNSKLIRETRVTPQRKDGGYSTSGMLAYDTRTKRAAYVARYANHITLLDDNLQITLNASTIDTFSSYRTTVNNTIHSNGETIENAGPQRYVNRSIAMNEGILFVNSTLRADNETMDSQNSVTVIDLYDQLDGTYLGSLRLDKSEGNLLRNFAVSNSKIYCLYPEHLKIYDIPKVLIK